jgi:hypothetical protein
MSDIPAQLASVFDAAEIAEIKARPFRMAPERTTDVLELAAGWAGRVEKFDRDRSLPWTDRTVWTEHDLAGALFVRDFLEECLGRLPEPIRRKLARFVEEADDRFRGYTVDDPAGRMGTVAGVDLNGRAWWWRRVPVDGPIVRDLANY